MTWQPYLDHLATHWKSYAGSVLGAFVCLNYGFHWVTPQVETALVAAAAALGVTALHHTVDDHGS